MKKQKGKEEREKDKISIKKVFIEGGRFGKEKYKIKEKINVKEGREKYKIKM